MTEANILAIGSTAQDLKRVALYIGRGATSSAKRFLEEAIKNSQLIDRNATPPYILKYIKEIRELSKISDQMERAEQALMIGCLMQNIVVATRH